jgi:predicted RNA binding protein with dsRBD fold (UPF0201 family)
MVQISIRVPVFPTEVPEKVILAVTNIFPDAILTFEDEHTLSGHASDIMHFAQLIKNAKIRDTVRAMLYKNLKSGKTHFNLNKQAAYAGVVSFAVGEPLGEISVEIEDANIHALIDTIAPDTTKIAVKTKNE